MALVETIAAKIAAVIMLAILSISGYYIYTYLIKPAVKTEKTYEEAKNIKVPHLVTAVILIVIVLVIIILSRYV